MTIIPGLPVLPYLLKLSPLHFTTVRLRGVHPQPQQGEGEGQDGLQGKDHLLFPMSGRKTSVSSAHI